MDVLIWGTTGQARVVRPIIEMTGHRVTHLADSDPAATSPFADLPTVLSPAEALALAAEYRERGEALGFVVAIGGRHGKDRQELSRSLQELGRVPLQAIHPSAVLGLTSTLGEGAQVLMGACVGEGAAIGSWTIVNTNASVDHDCRLGEGVHVMPGATLAGEIEVGDFASIGSNATVLPRIRIGSGAVVGAGAVVTKDVARGVVVIGNPARPREGAD
jgi:sugar O-acyltransferase (sialic acid O-acetyltransferase NeuD family)